MSLEHERTRQREDRQAGGRHPNSSSDSRRRWAETQDLGPTASKSQQLGLGRGLVPIGIALDHAEQGVVPASSRWAAANAAWQRQLAHHIGRPLGPPRARSACSSLSSTPLPQAQARSPPGLARIGAQGVGQGVERGARLVAFPLGQQRCG